MEQMYWLGRKRASLANAKAATTHYDLAGRYSIKAASSQSGGIRPTPDHEMTAAMRPMARTLKAACDTVAGCRSRAEADLLAAVSMLPANERIRMETSAASWIARADLLERRCQDLRDRKAAALERPLIV
jgi:hypothetical protein